jgi:hypothetical protein
MIPSSTLTTAAVMAAPLPRPIIPLPIIMASPTTPSTRRSSHRSSAHNISADYSPRTSAAPSPLKPIKQHLASPSSSQNNSLRLPLLPITGTAAAAVASSNSGSVVGTTTPVRGLHSKSHVAKIYPDGSRYNG